MKYNVEIMSRAIYDLMNIYHYIIDEYGEIETAKRLLSSLYEAVNNLEIFPYRCALRRTGRYANRGHRQLFVKNFTIIYRVDEPFNRVLIAAVRYTSSRF